MLEESPEVQGGTRGKALAQGVIGRPASSTDALRADLAGERALGAIDAWVRAEASGCAKPGRSSRWSEGTTPPFGAIAGRRAARGLELLTRARTRDAYEGFARSQRRSCGTC